MLENPVYPTLLAKINRSKNVFGADNQQERLMRVTRV